MIVFIIGITITTVHFTLLEESEAAMSRNPYTLLSSPTREIEDDTEQLLGQLHFFSYRHVLFQTFCRKDQFFLTTKQFKMGQRHSGVGVTSYISFVRNTSIPILTKSSIGII